MTLRGLPVAAALPDGEEKGLHSEEEVSVGLAAILSVEIISPLHASECD